MPSQGQLESLGRSYIKDREGCVARQLEQIIHEGPSTMPPHLPKLLFSSSSKATEYTCAAYSVDMELVEEEVGMKSNMCTTQKAVLYGMILYILGGRGVFI